MNHRILYIFFVFRFKSLPIRIRTREEICIYIIFNFSF